MLFHRFLSAAARFLFTLGAALALRAEVPQPQAARLQSSPVLRHLEPNPAGKDAAPGAAQTLAAMHVPKGFRVDLVAAEPDIDQPVAFAWDERGRLWVAEALSYPNKRPAGKGQDRIVILEDSDGDGRFETRKVFAEGLNLVSGLEVGFGGVWVGAAPELLFIPDRNHDDHPDGRPEVQMEGFGFQDTHECLNSFLWGPDGWLYGIQGVFNYARIGKPGASDAERTELRAGVWRFHPVQKTFEIFAHGGSNPWGIDFDERGELFMTHCRSYWGRGGTTHVMQNGQFWNQANANYAPYILAEPPAGFPELQNFLLASARYDHGAGGAGRPGSDAIYGGHSHIGTMIYLGDNWPDTYRGHLFTHNLHGHQINQQVNLPEASGYNTIHAGQDIFFCTDPKYVAIDLQYGPDGAVYIIDWYDQQHCHNPNNERWERGSGRVYRMAWEETWKPAKVDLGKLDDAELAALQKHRNHWFSRTSRRLLQERAQTGAVSAVARERLTSQLRANSELSIRLRGLWCLEAIGAVDNDMLGQLLQDPDEHVRAWGVRLAAARGTAAGAQADRFVSLAKSDPSAVVRRHLASALPQLDDRSAWAAISALSRRTEDGTDRNLVPLLWQGMAQRATADPAGENMGRLLQIAGTTGIPLLADWAYWYAASLEGPGLESALREVQQRAGAPRLRLMAALNLALRGRSGIAQPVVWKSLAPELYASGDTKVIALAESLAAAFGDTSRLPLLRKTLLDPTAAATARNHALQTLARAQDPEALPAFLQLLKEPAFRPSAIQVLSRYNSETIPAGILENFAGWQPAEKASALEVLTSRTAYALPLLTAVEKAEIPRTALNALHVRRLQQLKNPEIDRRSTAVWGRLQSSPKELQTRIDSLQKVFDEAPLWAFDGRAGRDHFVRLCASCHFLGADGTRLGPELTGANRNGIRYFLENIIDPNAVIGTDFQMTTVEKRNGEVISGLLISETPGSIQLRTTAEQIIVPKSEAAKRELSDRSLMPEGLLESLNEREQIELLKYLMSN